MRTPLSLLAALAFLNATAQSDSTHIRKHRHEVGLDLTSFFREFLHDPGSNTTGVDTYTPTYMFSYRYHLSEHCNLRFGVGASASDVERPNSYSPLLGETYHDKSSDFAIRVGAEWHQELGKRWQVFYGIDLRPSWQYDYTPGDYANGDYVRGHEEHIRNMGVAPLAGIRFFVTKRFSILTETSYALVQTTDERTILYTPRDYGIAPQASETSKSTSFTTVYEAPLMVVAAFDL